MAHIGTYLSVAAAQCDGLPLFSCGGRALTAKQVAGRVAALAVALEQRLGAQVGDCVCVAALATDHNLESLLAVTAAGCIAAPLNWRWGLAEGAHAARLVAARLLLVDAACLGFAAGVAEASNGGIRVLVLLGDPHSYSSESLRALPVPAVFAEALMAECRTSGSLSLLSAPNNAALVVYTSGTTGKPKGVVLSHAALHVQSLAKLLVVGYKGNDVYLHAAPLFHIGGISSALAMLMAGARHVFLPRFEPSGFLSAIQEHTVSSFIAVPAMVAALVDAAVAQGPIQLESVRTILLGGGGTSPALQAGLQALFPRASVLTAYGMTEACSSMTFHTLWTASFPATCLAAEPVGLAASDVSAASSVPASANAVVGQPGGNGGSQRIGEDQSAHVAGVYVGAAPPGIELAVFHPPQGQMPLPSHAGSSAAAWGSVVHEGEGEVVTRGPHVMLGYYEDDAATQATFLPGGWMRTGDLGYLKKGQLWLMGRAKDMIKSGGENVHAWEVERALGSHPAVATVAVVGVPDWRLGEAVAAVVVLREGWTWRGLPCQALLQTARAGAAAVSAAATAAVEGSAGIDSAAVPDTVAGAAEGLPKEVAVVAAIDALAGVGSEEAGELTAARVKVQAAARGWKTANRRGGAASGPMGAVLAVEEARHGAQRAQQHSPELAQLQRMAEGLLQLSSVLGASTEGSMHGSSGASGSDVLGQGPGGCNWVDGPALQQHCRSGGLAGFKLPRVFLALGADEALPVNSTGKVLKHLVQERVIREMAGGDHQQQEKEKNEDVLPRSRL